MTLTNHLLIVQQSRYYHISRILKVAVVRIYKKRSGSMALMKCYGGFFSDLELISYGQHLSKATGKFYEYDIHMSLNETDSCH